jgi:hypothetical protein
MQLHALVSWSFDLLWYIFRATPRDSIFYLILQTWYSKSYGLILLVSLVGWDKMFTAMFTQYDEAIIE